MRRLARYVFTVLFALSLLLCVAVCVLWQRSRSHGYTVRWHVFSQRGSVVTFHERCVSVNRGTFSATDTLRSLMRTDPQAALAEVTALRQRDPGYAFESHDPVPPPDLSTYAAKDRLAAQYGFRYRSVWVDRVVLVPAWAVVLATGIAATLCAAAARRHSLRRQRLASGLCGNCGYDLRAHRVGDRCPECGAAVP